MAASRNRLFRPGIPAASRTVSACDRQRGLGLLETLITVVLLAVGFIAIGSMQMRGLRMSMSAQLMSQGTLVAEDIIDRMKSNPDGVNAGHYDDVSLASTYVAPTCESSGCTASQQAARDLYEWSSWLYNVRDEPDFQPALPTTDPDHPPAAVVNKLKGGLYRVTVSWQDPTLPSNGSRQVMLAFYP